MKFAPCIPYANQARMTFQDLEEFLQPDDFMDAYYVRREEDVRERINSARCCLVKSHLMPKPLKFRRDCRQNVAPPARISFPCVILNALGKEEIRHKSGAY